MGDLNGNTTNIQIPAVHKNPMKVWCFTLPLSVCQPYQLSDILRSEGATWWVFQAERGAEGFEHYQGVMRFSERLRFLDVKNVMPREMHLEGCRDILASRRYCSKLEGRIAGPWNETSVFIRTIGMLHPWQQDLFDKLQGEPDDRTILWIYDLVGGAGKTGFSRKMAADHGAFVVNHGKTADIAHCIAANPEIVIMNIVRDCEERINYAVLEQLKDGQIMQSKYASRMRYFDPPHVVVFANFAPDTSKLSADRWRVYEIIDLVLQERLVRGGGVVDDFVVPE